MSESIHSKLDRPDVPMDSSTSPSDSSDSPRSHHPPSMSPANEWTPRDTARRGDPVRLIMRCLMALGIGLLIWSVYSTRSIDGDHPAVGKPAPRLDLVLLGENPPYAARDQLEADRVTLLHFWGTWCGPCKMEYPELAEMVQRFDNQPQFEFVSVSCEGSPQDTFDTLWEKTHDYLDSLPAHHAVFADPRGITRRSVVQRLDLDAMFYPTSILIGPDGKIVGVWEGYAPESVQQIERQIHRLLSQLGSQI